MVGLHSDWHRKLTVRKGWRLARINLMADTGWWRGSNLYRHTSGVHILHEGQAGCIVFSTAPPAHHPHPEIDCTKSDAPGEGSAYYSDFTYLGSFLEGRREVPFRFVPATLIAEPELPDIL